MGVQISGSSPGWVLLVEDDPAVAAVIRASLERAAITVVLARNVEEAVRAVDGADGALNLVISDVVLGTESAPAVLQRALGASAGKPLLLISGFSLHYLSLRGDLPEETVDNRRTFFLQKPFTPRELLSVVRGILPAPSQPPASGGPVGIQL
jgi:DNA-binding NtrC family response regulator